MDVFIARQPIFNRKKDVVAYELLYRASREAHAFSGDIDVASATTMVRAFLEIGLPRLTGGKPAHINCTQQNLLDETHLLLPPEQAVIEVLETVEPLPSVIATLEQARARGYRIALDDFVYRPALAPLLQLAHVVKVDFRTTSQADIQQTLAATAPFRVTLLAERVETQDEVKAASELGFALFQGYFFARPENFVGRAVPTPQLVVLQLLEELEDDNIEFHRLESLIAGDVGMSVRLLRYINSAWHSLRSRVDSIKSALTLVGLEQVRKWVRVLAVAQLATDKPSELLVLSLVRARFCELVAAPAATPPQRAFIVGLLSLLDAILDTPMADILSELHLHDDLVRALVGEPGALSSLLALARAFETGDWGQTDTIAQALGLDGSKLGELYVAALEHAESFHRMALDPL